MKKILFLFAFLLSFAASHAQNTYDSTLTKQQLLNRLNPSNSWSSNNYGRNIVHFSENIARAISQTKVDSLGAIIPGTAGLIYTGDIADDAVTQSKLADALLAYLLDRGNHTGTQAISTIVGLQDSLNQFYDQAYIDAQLTNKAGINHAHQITDVTYLQDSLSEKANLSHIHDTRYYTESEVDAQMLNKSGVNHGHTVGDVTGLQDSLDLMSDTLHIHDERYYTKAQSDNLINQKADDVHDHILADITDFDDSGYADAIHNHGINDVANLQDSLSNKSNSSHLHDGRYYTENEVDVITGQLAPISRAIPPGGASGYVLKKSSSSDYAVTWAYDNTGGGGGGPATMGVVYIDSDTTVSGWDLQSNTRYVGSNGAVITVNNLLNQGGLVIDGDSNIIIENVIIDLNTDDDVGNGNGDSNNFATCITIRDANNIRILDSEFINSNRANADPDWTLHAIEAQNTNVLHVVNCRSFGAQFKLDGGSGSLSNVFFDNNFVSECTQMGVSAVVQPSGANVVLRNINITNNVFKDIDNHAIYLGNDNGAGSYTGTVTMENINVTGNNIYGLAYLNSTQNSKGILVNLTKDSERINISENVIVGASGNTSVQGININTASQDVSSGNLGHSITVKNNKISGTGGPTGGFSIFLTEVEGFQVTDNILADGKGLRLLNCVDGRVFGNQDRGNVGAMFRFDTCTGIISDKPYADDTEALADGLSNGDFYFKSGAGYVAIGGSLASTLSQEEVEDYTGAMFDHANHSGITPVYDDGLGQVRLTVDFPVSGDSYIDQIWKTPLEYHDTLGVALGSNSQTGSNYVDVNDIIGQPGFADLADLKAFFNDVPEITSATALTDFDRGGTGDAQGVSLDYAVLRQMFENSYNFMFPAQVNYRITHDLPIKEGGYYLGAVNRDDINATKFSQTDGCDCNIFISRNIDLANNNWHLSGAIRDISFEGDAVTNISGSGVWVKNMGENFEIKNIRSNRFPEHGIKITGNVAPIQLFGPSTHRNGEYGIYFETDATNNSEKEIIIYGPTGDANPDGLIGLNMSYASMTILNFKLEGNSRQGIDILNGNGTRLLVVGGAFSAYDAVLGQNGPDINSLVRLNYDDTDNGFNNPVIRFLNFRFDDIPNAIEDVVTGNTYSINNNEEHLDWTYTRDTGLPIAKGKYHKGIPDYGTLDAFTVGNSLRFHNSRHYKYGGTSTIYLNNYTAWTPGVFQEILMNSSSKPGISISGSVPGPGVLREIGNNFQANVTQLWTITYDGVDTAGNAIYRLTIE